MLVYLVLNAIFVLAPAPGVIAGREDVAALAANALAGEGLASAMRAIIAMALLTSVSAMMMAGPRVYAQMAADGLMPQILRFREEVPSAAVALQGALAILVVWMTGLRELLSYLGFTLGLSAAASVASLFIVVRRRGLDTARIRGYPWAPIIFVTMTLVFAALAATHNPREMVAAIVTLLLAVLVYYLFGRQRQRLVD
jgi:APA family basic amino acid/polyamine antiporter